MFFSPSKINVSANAVVGSVIHFLHAEDDDLGENGRLKYALTGGNDDGTFAIDPDSGIDGIIALDVRDKSIVVTLWRL